MIYSLKDKTAALLVVDVQHEYFDEDGPAFVESAADTLPNINRLIDEFAAAGQQVVYIRHVFKADGSDVGRMGDFDGEDGEDGEDSFIEGTPGVELTEGLHVVADASEVIKNRYDSFANTNLHELLQSLGVTTVAIAGFMTSFCCDSTARGAHSLDYEVLFVRDAIEGPDLEYSNGEPYNHAAVLEDVSSQLAAGFAEIVETDDVISRLN